MRWRGVKTPLTRRAYDITHNDKNIFCNRFYEVERGVMVMGVNARPEGNAAYGIASEQRRAVMRAGLMDDFDDAVGGLSRPRGLPNAAYSPLVFQSADFNHVDQKTQMAQESARNLRTGYKGSVDNSFLLRGENTEASGYGLTLEEQKEEERKEFTWNMMQIQLAAQIAEMRQQIDDIKRLMAEIADRMEKRDQIFAQYYPQLEELERKLANGTLEKDEAANLAAQLGIPVIPGESPADTLRRVREYFQREKEGQAKDRRNYGSLEERRNDLERRLSDAERRHEGNEREKAAIAASGLPKYVQEERLGKIMDQEKKFIENDKREIAQQRTFVAQKRQELDLQISKSVNASNLEKQEAKSAAALFDQTETDIPIQAHKPASVPKSSLKM